MTGVDVHMRMVLEGLNSDASHRARSNATKLCHVGIIFPGNPETGKLYNIWNVNPRNQNPIICLYVSCMYLYLMRLELNTSPNIYNTLKQQD